MFSYIGLPFSSFIKDINSFYGEYQAGEDINSRAPLNEYKQDDCEASVVHERGVE